MKSTLFGGRDRFFDDARQHINSEIINQAIELFWVRHEFPDPRQHHIVHDNYGAIRFIQYEEKNMEAEINELWRRAVEEQDIEALDELDRLAKIGKATEYSSVDPEDPSLIP